MIERTGDIWAVRCDVRAVTTNGTVKKSGSCVMGRGVALQAAQRFPGIQYQLGSMITRHGNHCFLLQHGLVSLPVKHTWRQVADPGLIGRSLLELEKMADLYNWDTVVLPRPGCGNGQLKWDTGPNPVRRLVEDMDDRFVVVELEQLGSPVA